MSESIDRRDFLRVAAYGGVAFASGLGITACAKRPATPTALAPHDDFYFVQLSDTHWGYEGPANADARGTLPKAIAAVNGLSQPPDFVVFTGDLTHLTLDAKARRARMEQFRNIAGQLKVTNLRFLPGEHDASADHGEAFQEYFGPTHYTFDHKGVHFIALDNVSDPNGALGEQQIAWLAADLAQRQKDAPIVVLTHRPLFDLVPEWGWATADAPRAIQLLQPFSHVTVFYGHIHQEHHRTDGSVSHHAAKSLIFPLPPPGSPDHKPIAWDAAHPYRGLGWRQIEGGRGMTQAEISESSLQNA